MRGSARVTSDRVSEDTRHKESAPKLPVLQQPETIKESPLIFDRPVQVTGNFTFTVPKGEALFGFGNGILDDYSLFIRLFVQSGRRYTPQIYLGPNPITGRPDYSSDLNRLNEGVGETWFVIDLNFDKYIDLGFGKLVVSLEVQNLLDRKNSQIINPVTGRAYEYGDPTPLRDPRSPLSPA